MIYDVMLRASLALTATAVVYSVLFSCPPRVRVSARGRHRVLSLGTAATLLVLALSVLPHWAVLPNVFSLTPTHRAVGVGPTDGAAFRESLTDARSAGSVKHDSVAIVDEAPLFSGLKRALAVAESSGFQVALLLLWALGAVALIIRLLAGERRLAELVEVSDPLPDDCTALMATTAVADSSSDNAATGELEVRVGPTRTAILAAPLFGPTAILIPPAFLDWPPMRLRLVLAHERAHLHRADPTWLRLSLALRALLFWNPLAWYLTARLRREAELATDETVLADGVKATDYAEMLLRAAVGDERVDASIAGTGFAVSTSPEVVWRVTAVLDAATSRELSLPWQRALAAMAFLGALLFGCAAPAETRPPEQGGRRAPATSEAPAASSGQDTPRGATADERAAPQRAEADHEIQAHASRLLTTWTQRPSVRSARLVVLEATRGRILTAMQSTRGEAPVNRLDVVLPGSTLKPFVAAAALEEGFRRDTVLPGGALTILDGEEIRDYTDHGPLDLDAVIARSSNVGLAHVVRSTPLRRLHAVLGDLRLRAAGEVLPTGRDRSAAVRAVLGESAQVHPVMLAAAYAVFVNGGEWVEPTTTGDGARRRVLTTETANALRDMLRGAVTRSDGTARRARVLETAAGKTGTIKTDTGRRALFVGWVEAQSGPVIAYVDVEVEGPSSRVYGGSTAVPAFVEAVEALVR